MNNLRRFINKYGVTRAGGKYVGREWIPDDPIVYNPPTPQVSPEPVELPFRKRFR